MKNTAHIFYRSNGVALLEVDNPPVNALDEHTLIALKSMLNEALAHNDVRAIVLTGRGSVFSGGADLKEGGSAKERQDPSLLMEVLAAVSAIRLPIIAAINGHCIGGALELALCCDLRLASKAATFVCAGVNVGLSVSAYRLPRLIGESRAKAMLFTGLAFDATTAERFGLVTAIHEPEQLLIEALRLAERIASRAPLSVEAIKRVIEQTNGLSSTEAQAVEANELRLLLDTEDHREALMAFREKRRPHFTRH